MWSAYITCNSCNKYYNCYNAHYSWDNNYLLLLRSLCPLSVRLRLLITRLFRLRLLLACLSLFIFILWHSVRFLSVPLTGTMKLFPHRLIKPDCPIRHRLYSLLSISSPVIISNQIIKIIIKFVVIRHYLNRMPTDITVQTARLQFITTIGTSHTSNPLTYCLIISS